MRSISLKTSTSSFGFKFNGLDYEVRGDGLYAQDKETGKWVKMDPELISRHLLIKAFETACTAIK